MINDNEPARLDALYQRNLLDTPPSESFDRITRMASQLFQLPISAVSLTDHDRQWFKSRVGVEHNTIPRYKAPCAQVAETTRTLVIPDFMADDWYRDSLLADSGIRFYAGAPLTTRDGFGLGSLCVLGTEPRKVTAIEISALEDLAAMVMSQIELQHAFGRIDPLSGLPNRTQFLEDLEDLANDAQSGVRRMAVLLDLAKSEQINHALQVMGSIFVDAMVQKAARMLRTALGPSRIGYHVASTQFAWIAPEDADEVMYLQSLKEAINASAEEEISGFLTTLAIGVAPFMPGQVDPRDVLRTAHSAVMEARACDVPVSLYCSTRDDDHRRRFTILSDFGTALERFDQLRLVFQPRIDLASGACIGSEALLRWTHPSLGEISPGEFIPIIEQTSLAKRTTEWVLDAALKQVAAWRARGIALPISVNVSATNLEEPGFSEQVATALERHGLQSDCLELEVTETAVMMNGGKAMAHLEALAAAGVKLAIDDFGTGYSSLSYLQRLPAHVLKIDQSFVKNLAHDERALRLIKTMISLSHELDYRVVAEGVESQEVADILSGETCDEAQGYHFAHPLEPVAFERWLETAGKPEPVAEAA